MRVGLVTYARAPALTADDERVAAELRGRGARVDAVGWDDPSVRWADLDRIVLRSCWDYHHRPQEFLDWIGRLEGQGAPLWNPPAVVRANAHKSYLRGLGAAGVPVLPTAWLARGERADLAELLAERGWMDAVVKPAVSASAHGTWRTGLDRAREDQARLAELLERGDVLVQPFAPEIERAGELSLIFFGGAYSHTVCKRPARGDFRVQKELGGSEEAVDPPPALLDQAATVLERLDGPWLYARVDGIEREGVLVLLELELIEPHLFLAQDPQAPVRFADAILRPGLR